jgi:hypothetical protein
MLDTVSALLYSRVFAASRLIVRQSIHVDDRIAACSQVALWNTCATWRYQRCCWAVAGEFPFLQQSVQFTWQTATLIHLHLQEQRREYRAVLGKGNCHRDGR